jgi:glycosyltransferase involved in cell wall biosynthesis
MRSKSRRSRKVIVWIVSLVIDTDVCRTAQIEILNHLSKIGYGTDLFAMWSKRPYPIKNGVHVDCIPLRYFPVIQPLLFSILLFFLVPVYALVKRPRYIIVSPGPPVLVFVWKLLLSKFLKSKIILDIRSTPVETTGWRGHLQEFMFDLSVIIARSVFDGFTIITTGMRDEVAKRYNMDPDAFGVWTSGVSTQTFQPDRYSNHATRLREENGLSGKFIVFYHGSLGMRRGIIETVKSIDIVKSKCDDLVLFLLGKGPALPIIQRLIDEKGLQGRVFIHDVVDYDEVPKYIAMADVAIVPLPNITDWINQSPLKLLEYMAMAKPVIITDIPANRSFVGDSECGLYARSANPEDIAKAIVHSYTLKHELKARGAAGRVIVEEKCDWKLMADCLDRYLASR